jgi:excisionase family DNA binding protein
MVREKKDRLLTVNQVARKLGFLPRQIYMIIKKGDIPCVRIGLGRGVIRVKESDLEAYIERKKSDTTKAD